MSRTYGCSLYLTEPLPEAEPPYNFVLSINEERENLVCACKIFDFEIPLPLKKRSSSMGDSFFHHICLRTDMDDDVSGTIKILRKILKAE